MDCSSIFMCFRFVFSSAFWLHLQRYLSSSHPTLVTICSLTFLVVFGFFLSDILTVANVVSFPKRGSQCLAFFESAFSIETKSCRVVVVNCLFL